MKVTLRSAVILATFAFSASLAGYAGAQLGTVGGSTPAVAVPTKVAIVSPSKVFADMQQTKDLKQKMDGQTNDLQSALRLRAEKLKNMQDEMQLIKVDSQQYIDKSREFTAARIEAEAFRQTALADLDRDQRLQMRALFEKIQGATAKLAQQKGYDIVLADGHDDIPANLENITLKDLRSIIMSRAILYARPEVDLTLEVTTLLDAEYKK